MKGQFIVFEGGEGCGKTTQITRLSHFLSENNRPHIVVREPGGTEGGEKIRNILFHGKKDLWEGMSEALLLYASRYELVTKVIKPALKEGKWVLCDRFCYSTWVYQGSGRNIGIEPLQKLHKIVLEEFTPDLVIYLSINPQEAFARIRTRTTTDRFESMDMEFHQKVFQAYEKIADENPIFNKIDTSQSIENVHESIKRIIKEKLMGKSCRPTTVSSAK